jgi:hypothetical protein
MFEYWIYNEDISTVLFLIHEEAYKIHNDYIEYRGDYVWFFQAKNIFVIQSPHSFGDGNSLLDEILLTLAKNFNVHDMGIAKTKMKY